MINLNIYLLPSRLDTVHPCVIFKNVLSRPRIEEGCLRVEHPEGKFTYFPITNIKKFTSELADELQ
jgi:hypothetical protein